MSFAATLDNLALRKSAALRRFEDLIAPKSDLELESMAQDSRALTLQHFGRTMRLFAPLYLSNECINNCRYCGFSRDNPILRVTLTVEEVLVEARYLRGAGFRQILLVAGEHPKFVSGNYLVECVRALAPDFSSISIEVGPMSMEEYVPVVRAGAEGLVVYQETYQRAVYAELHTAGPKRDFDYRLDCPERAYAAGFRRIGIGALFGLWRWREEAVALAAHVDYLLRKCWQAQITVSLPRLRPAAGGFTPLFSITDRELAQLVCALRICFPQAAILNPVVTRIAGSSVSIRRCAGVLFRRNFKMAKINSRPVSLKLAMTGSRRESQKLCVNAASSRFGRTGTRRFRGDAHFAQRRGDRFTRRAKRA